MKNNTPYFIHESSYADAGAIIGEGTKIWHFSNVANGAVIGKDCMIGQNIYVGPKVRIGDRCKIQNNVSFGAGAILDDDVFCGPSCVFTNIRTPRSFIIRKDEFLPTKLCRGSSIGANATLIGGITIGAYALIGAGALVTKDVPDYGFVIGVPARQIGWVCKCGEPMRNFEDKKTKCEMCAEYYYINADKRLEPLG